jgi:hypothetical protein
MLKPSELFKPEGFASGELCVVLDRITGKVERPNLGTAVMDKEAAVAYVRRMAKGGWAERLVIVELNVSVPLREG